MTQTTVDVTKLPGIKERDLRSCDLCGERHGVVLYRVTLEQAVIDQGAVQRQVGLGLMMGGSAALASLLGQDEDMAKIVTTSRKLVCADCAGTMPILACHGDAT